MGGGSALQPRLSGAFNKGNQGQDFVYILQIYACIYIQHMCIYRHMHTYNISAHLLGNLILRLENVPENLQGTNSAQIHVSWGTEPL